MSNYGPVGYTHSDGYVLCPVCAKHGKLRDSGNESGYVQAFFQDSEWDHYPVCDDCQEEIDDVNLTTEGQTWLAEREGLDDDEEEEEDYDD